MANSKKTKIKILNPVKGCGLTSLEHARRYVRRGQARWVGPAIEFITTTEVLAGDRALTQLLVEIPIRDARPGLPILPPSREWMERMGYMRDPILVQRLSA